MNDNNCAILIEPEFEETYWGSRCLHGIKQEVMRNKGNIIRISPNDIGSLKSRSFLILVGSLVSWMTNTVSILSGYDIHAILVTAPVPNMVQGASTVSTDYRQAFDDLCTHLRQTGAERIALFGVHPNSVNDLNKLQAFCACMGQPQQHSNIYWNNGQVTKLCREFYDTLDQYDAVLCTNDIIAIRLKEYLLEQHVHIPDRLKLATIGETRLAQLVKPGITSAALNFQDIGRQAVRMYRLLVRNPELTELHAKVAATISVRESTGGGVYTPAKKEWTAPALGTETGFYEDCDVKRIFRLENLISHCMPVDFAIIKGLLAGTMYHHIAESCFIAENTLKYRIKRMLELTESGSREELLLLIRQYLKPENIPDE